MNQEIINKINDAIKNNDVATIERLKKDYNLTITKIDSTNMIKNKHLNYFREIPCKNDLFIIYYLASNHKILTQESDIIGAFLLHWFKNDKIYLKSIKKGFFKKNRLLIKFNDNIIIEDVLEKQMYDFLKNISIDNIIEYRELHKWVNKHEFEFNIFLQNIKISCYDRLAQEGLINIINSSENYPTINEEAKEFKKTYNITTKKIGYTLTPKYQEYLNQIIDFKNFMQEFSKINDKKIQQVELWEDYLIVSQLLGLADAVSEQLNKLIPGFKTKNKKGKLIIKLKKR